MQEERMMMRRVLMPFPVLLIPVFILFTVTEALACTGVYVGPEASADGTTIIARCNDLHPTVMPTIVKVYDRVENEPGRIFDCRNGFSWPLPDTNYRYVCIPFTTAAQETAQAIWEDAAGGFIQ